MSRPKSVEKLCEMFWQLENEFDLLDKEIQGVKVWQYMRMQIYYTIAEKSSVFQTPHAQKQTIYGRLKKLLTYTRGLIFYNPFLIFNQNIDEIVIDHPRHKYIDGQNIDIYSHYYLDDLRKREIDYLVLDRPFLDQFHAKTNTENRKFLDTLILMSALRAKFFPVRLNVDEINLIKKIGVALNRKFDINIDLLTIFTVAISKFQSNYTMYHYLLSKLNPGKLVIVVSYAYGDAIKAAKDLGIETVEIQHGTFSRYHLGYSFPNMVGNLDYFPDKFMAWGDYWKNLDVIPLPDKNIVISGFTHFNDLRGKYKDFVQKQDQILVLSQGALGTQIADKILEQVESLASYSIMYKLHPGEYSRWKEYESLVELSKLPNIQIVKDEDIYKLFAESAFQIGVFSTALYEGLGFGCRTILLDLPGIEYMNDLIKENVVKVLQKDESILSVMGNYSQEKSKNHTCSDIFYNQVN